MSSFALGLLLIAASYLYQRYAERLGDAERNEPATESPLDSVPEDAVSHPLADG